MKKIIVLIMVLTSSASFSSPTWIEFLIKVENPQNALKIVAATDKFMESDFVKNNFTNFLYFLLFVFIWLLYAVAYLFKYKEKNIAYNLLDLISKNLFGLFILYIIYSEKSKLRL